MMKPAVFVVLLGCAVVVQCDKLSVLREWQSFDFSQIFDSIFTVKMDDFDDVSRSRIREDGIFRGREYDRDKCWTELGAIADGLNQTEMWALNCKFILSLLDAFH